MQPTENQMSKSVFNTDFIEIIWILGLEHQFQLQVLSSTGGFEVVRTKPVAAGGPTRS